MKQFFIFMGITAACLSFTACPTGGGGNGPGGVSNGIPVEFLDIRADGGEDATTTKLTLSFDADIEGLSAEDITLEPGTTGAVRGGLSPSGEGVYELALGGISAGGEISVSPAKDGYTVSPASRSVTVHYYADPNAVAAAFTGLAADGDETAATTKLTFTFDKDIEGLNAAGITLDPGDTGLTTGELSRTGAGVYELAVTAVTEGGEVTAAAAKTGYTISPASRTVTVWGPPPLSADSALKSLGVRDNTGAITLTPAFDPAVTKYTGYAALAATTVTIEAEARDGDAGIEGTGGAFPADTGARAYHVIVTAPDGTATDYTVSIYRKGSIGFSSEGWEVESPLEDGDTALFKQDAAGNFLTGGDLYEKTITVQNAEVYGAFIWKVDGEEKGREDSITLRAGDYANGPHELSLTVFYKDDPEVPWAAELIFTVQQQNTN
jgi:hypothetical protein